MDNTVSYGNCIYAPLFGLLVPKGKTVFVEPETLKPYSNQWALLESVDRVTEEILDDIIVLNDLSVSVPKQKTARPIMPASTPKFGLPPRAQRMLSDGVSKYQRVNCFRLAVHLKRLGLPHDVALAALKEWSTKNRPHYGKQVITVKEIREQSLYVYNSKYRGFGCNTVAVAPFCVIGCPLSTRAKGN